MLILWDIDGTMLVTQRSGMAAMRSAGQDLFSPNFKVEGVDYAGRLDPLIIEELFRLNDVPFTPENLHAIKLGYQEHLARLVAQPGRASSLPGVPALLHSLAQNTSLTQGLLTGNWETSGLLKLRAAGIDHSHFKIRVWGDESPHSPPKREHLPRVAMDRLNSLRGNAIDPSKVTIIGDTPNDVHCAKVHGCRSLGVATGIFSVADLSSAGATHAVKDLSDVASIYRWLVD